MYQITLTNEQSEELIRLTREKEVSPRTRLRVEMVRLNNAGFHVSEIARLLDQHESTVRHWLRCFLKGGFGGLNDKPHPGRVSAISAEILEAVREEVGKGERTWTAKQIAQWVAQHHGVTLSAPQMRLHLRRSGLSYQRSSYTVKHKQKPQDVEAKTISLQTLEKGGTPDSSTSPIVMKPASP